MFGCQKMSKKKQTQFLLRSVEHAFSARQQYTIWEFRENLAQKFIHQDLNYFKNIYQFYQFFLSDFFGQNVLAPPDQNVLIPPYQNVCIIFVQNIYWEYQNSLAQRIIHKALIQFKIFVNFVNFFCEFFWFEFLGPKCANNLYTTDSSGPKCLSSFCE